MPDIPGLPVDVYFGDAERALPDWRAEGPEEAADDDGDAPLTAAERRALLAMLGFDPSAAEDEDAGRP